MLSDSRTHTTLPSADMARARAFYEGVLGLVPEFAEPGGVMYTTGAGTHFLVFPLGGRGSGSHTQIGFAVADILAAVGELRRGASRSRPTPSMASIRPARSPRPAPFGPPGSRTRMGNLLSVVQGASV